MPPMDFGAGGFGGRLRVFVGASLVLLMSVAAAAQPEQPRTLLAIFAHPDDETWVGPVLAHYARNGVKVYLVIATKGEKGANARAAIPSGDQLAEVRHAEALCACQQLGIEPPIFLGFKDRELDAGSTEPEAVKSLRDLSDRVRNVIADLKPQVIVTWGPEGLYGHPDHRLVSDVVTEVVQSLKPGIKLYYTEFSTQEAELTGRFPGNQPGVDPAYLTATVRYKPEDRDAYHRALECHKSQFSPEAFKIAEQKLDQAWNGKVSFRPWFGNRKTHDLFK